MWFLGNASSPAIRAAITAGEIGMMATPAEGRSPAFAPVWAADNGCFGTGWPGETAWRAWLDRYAAHAPRCLFATAPDVVGDARATLARSRPWLSEIRARGYPAALVAQEGLEHLDVPWEEFDVLFLGGRDTAWKLGPAVAKLAREALRRAKPVHLGRCNSATRWRYAQALGCRSVDGTFLTFAPTTNLARLRRWLRSPPTGPEQHRRPTSRPAIRRTGRTASHSPPRPAPAVPTRTSRDTAAG